jgi:NADPH2:quinone reductase
MDLSGFVLREGIRPKSEKFKGVLLREYGPASSMSWSPLDELDYRLMATDVLIKIRATSVNHFDVLLRSGYFARGQKLQKPFILGKLTKTYFENNFYSGSDAAGIIVQKGRQVTEFELGDRVYTAISTKTGTYAKYCVASVLDGTVHALPDTVSFAEGACYGLPYFVAHRILAKLSRLPPRATLLVKGASGAVGNAIAQVGSALNLRVYGTAGSFNGQKAAKECGCLQVFNHVENSNEELVKLVKTRVGGVDLLVESKPENLQSDLAMMKPGGRVILLGPHEEKVQLYLRPFLAKEVYLSGVNLANAKVNDLFEVNNKRNQGRYNLN